MRTLVLDQGYQPHRIVSWQRAVTMLFIGKADVVEEYDDIVRSVRLAMRVPAVVRLRKHLKYRKPTVKFSRLNVMMRDEFSCQYCGDKKMMRDLTYDHVLPRSRGGETTWQNIVTACRPCNEQKGSQTPKEARMPLRSVPIKPDWLPTSGLQVSMEEIPDHWQSWVSWS